MADRKEIIPIGRIESRIFFLRGKKVMLRYTFGQSYHVKP